MRILLALTLCLWTATAVAQPALTPPGAAPAMLALSADDVDILERGPISDLRYVGGVVGALSFGFGMGQLIQGRWSDTGWIFTVGEGAAFVGIFAGLAGSLGPCVEQPCANHRGAEALAIGSLLAFAGLHLWEIGDAAIAPSTHNERFRQLSAMLGGGTYAIRATPYVAPAARGDGAVAGLALRF
jgi:hypothetical protein